MSKTSKQRRDRAKARAHGEHRGGSHASGSTGPRRKVSGGRHAFRLFMLYVVLFGTGAAFVGLMGGDDLPGSGALLWILVAGTFLAATIATVVHVRSGNRSAIDQLADKW